MTTYKITREINEGPKKFKLRLMELYILSLSAIFVLLSFNKNTKLLYPALIMVFDIIFLLIALARGANKNLEKIYFEDDGHTLKSRVEMFQVSYEITISEQWSLGIYAVSILLFFVITAQWI